MFCSLLKEIKAVFYSFLFAMVATISQGQTLFESDFGNADGWMREYGGQWQIENGICQGKTRSIWAGDKNWDNYIFKVKARCVEGGDEGQIWLSFRYGDEWNRYAIAIRGGLLDDVSLFRYRETEVPEPKVMCPLNIPLGFDFKGNEWYDIRIEAIGGAIKVWIGDTVKPQIHYTDASPIANGAIALGGNYHLCEFDDVSVQKLSPDDADGADSFADSAIKINFGPESVQIKGYVNSDGSQYTVDNGLGWDKDITGFTRKRNANNAAESDTVITIAHEDTQAVFMMDLPNGEYYVTSIAGDPVYPTYFNAYLQDTILLSDANIPAGHSLQIGKFIEITDNQLRLRLNRPRDKDGLALAGLVIEKWADVSEAKKLHEKELMRSREQQAAAKLVKEKKRKEHRNKYRSVIVNTINEDNRTNVSLDGPWLFMPDQDIDKDIKAYSPDESDLSWHVLEVPNFWNQIAWWTMEMAQFGERGNSMAYRHDEIRRTAEYTFDYGNTQSAWYRQWIEIPQSARNSKVFIKFDAVASASEVYINGHKAGGHLGMFTPFEIDLTDYIKYGQQNLIAVHVSGGAYEQTADSDNVAGVAVSLVITDEMLNSMPKGIYRSQATSDDFHDNKKLSRPNGIWQPVQLIITPKIKLADVFFKPRLDGGEIEVNVNNINTEDFKGKLEITLAGGNIEKQISIPPESSKLFRLDIDVDNPNPWTPETPYLYELEVMLTEGGKQIDSFNCNVGFRTFEVIDDQFYFNGKPRWMGGADMPPHGLRPNDEKLANKFMKLMHDGNQRITRAVCSPFTPLWADAADKQGVAVSIEGTWPWLGLYEQPMPDDALMEIWQNEMIDLVKSLRNHPSIVMWTIGNEFNYHPKYHEHKGQENPEQLYLEKMKVLSEFVEKIRQLDPTRPICLWSNYVREKDIYERILRPNSIDDGDITDPHLSCGYALGSTFRDGYYNGGYLPEYAGQPIMSQEASTCYPNTDNGSCERTYIQLYVPQAWIGDDAYEHRDPNFFLNYNAFITKEWMEDVRRTRRTAGWMAFCNSCWFQYSSFAEHIKPYSTYYKLKTALQPILPSLDQRDRHYYAGDIFKGSIVVVNDDVDFKSYDDITCIATLFNSMGEALLEKEIRVGKCDYYAKAEAKFEIRVPENGIEVRENCKLELVLKSESRTLGQNSYDLLIANRSWAFNTEETGRVAFIEADDKTAEMLEYLGAKGISFDRIGKQKAVIWANKPLPSKSDDSGMKLLEYVENGGILIALQPLNAQDFVPGDIIKEKFEFLWAVEFANIEIPSHKIFDGFASQDLRWWNGNGSSPQAAEISYVLNSSGNVLILAEHIPTHVYGWKGPVATPMFMVNYGKGIILISELETSSADTDPLAGRMLSNIVGWAAAE